MITLKSQMNILLALVFAVGGTSAIARAEDKEPRPYNVNDRPHGWFDSPVIGNAEDWSRSPYSNSNSRQSVVTREMIDAERSRALQEKADRLKAWLATPFGQIFSAQEAKNRAEGQARVLEIIKELREERKRLQGSSFDWVAWEAKLAEQEQRFVDEAAQGKANSKEIAKFLSNLMLGSEFEAKNFLRWGFGEVKFLDKTGVAFTRAYNAFLIDQKVIIEFGGVRSINTYYYQLMAKYAAFRNYYIQKGLKSGLNGQELFKFVQAELYNPDLYLKSSPVSHYYQTEKMLGAFYDTAPGGKMAQPKTWSEYKQAISEGFLQLSSLDLGAELEDSVSRKNHNDTFNKFRSSGLVRVSCQAVF